MHHEAHAHTRIQCLFAVKKGEKADRGPRRSELVTFLATTASFSRNELDMPRTSADDSPIGAILRDCHSVATIQTCHHCTRGCTGAQNEINIPPVQCSRNVPPSSECQLALDMPTLNPLIQAIAPELLSYVFHFAIDAVEDTMTAARTLLNMTWVCSRWRYVALKDAVLWARTMFIKGIFRPGALVIWRDRAGQTSFDLRISDTLAGGDHVHSPDSLIHRGLNPSNGLIWTLLHTTFAVTMKSLALDFEHEHTASSLMFHLFCAGDGYVLPQLKTLSFHRHDMRRGLLKLNSIFTQDIDGSDFPGLSPNVRTPCLRHLSLSNLDHSHLTEPMLANTLHHCNNITHLVLHQVTPRMDVVAFSRPVMLRNCKHLWISPGRFWTQPRAGVLALFDAPNVETLALADLSPQDFIMYIVHACRMHPRVRSLHLERMATYSDVADSFLAGYFYNLPLIEFLHANGVDQHLFRVLLAQTVEPPVPDPGKTFAPGGVTLLPRLQRIELRNLDHLEQLAQDLRRGRLNQGTPVDVVVG